MIALPKWIWPRARGIQQIRMASQFLNFRAYPSVPAMPGLLKVAQHAVLGRFKKRASPDRDG